LSVGAGAGVGWFSGSCGYCRRCRRDDAFACENVHEISGVTRDGRYATHMIAHVSAVAHVSDDLDAVESAPLLCAGVTTFKPFATRARGRATSSPFTASAALGIWESSSRRGRASHSRGQPRPRQGGARPQARR
jgi:D-arabinose 1-dehydrogenase-like Zn-dependent alcohol dehydrogenase